MIKFKITDESETEIWYRIFNRLEGCKTFMLRKPQNAFLMMVQGEVEIYQCTLQQITHRVLFTLKNKRSL